MRLLKSIRLSKANLAECVSAFNLEAKRLGLTENDILSTHVESLGGSSQLSVLYWAPELKSESGLSPAG